MEEQATPMSEETNNNNDGGPYGRDRIPTPMKAPSYFSLLKPIKFLIWAWFWSMNTTFKDWWVYLFKEAQDSYDQEMLFGLLLIIGSFVIGITQVLPVYLIASFGFGLTGWWIFDIILGFYLIHLIIYFTFHLHEKEGLQHWKDKLLS